MIDLISNSSVEEVKSSRSHKRRALFYNQYLSTAGGGERLCFEIALALESVGYEISFVVSGDESVDLDRLCKAFGMTPLGSWSFLNVPTPGDIGKLCREGNFDIFINNTFESYIENTAPLGFYVVMFPQQLCSSQNERIATYHILYCISNFTKLYTLRRWSGIGPKVKVAVPSISDIHLLQPKIEFSEKEKLILCIGRFNVRGHSKCQLEAIKSFVKFQGQGLLDQSWRLVIAGRVNEGADNLRYLGECLQASSKNVTIFEGLPIEDLIELYRKASVLWQFTGYGKDFGIDPEYCEHLGLVALDCFAYGTIPIVYQRGGMPYIIDHGINGYCFADEKELGEIMNIFSKNFGNEFHEFQFQNSKLTASSFTFEKFAEKITEFIKVEQQSIASL